MYAHITRLCVFRHCCLNFGRCYVSFCQTLCLFRALPALLLFLLLLLHFLFLSLALIVDSVFLFQFKLLFYSNIRPDIRVLCGATPL